METSSLLRRLVANSKPILLLFSSVLLVISVALNVALAEQLRRSNNKLSKMDAEARIEVGTILPDIAAKNLDGNNATFSFSSTHGPTVIYVFSPSCTWCAKNHDNLRTLVEGKSLDYQFVGLSISNLNIPEYVAAQNWKFPVFMEPSVATVSAYKLGGTPQTLVVSADGKVLKNWTGAYTANVQKEVEDYFHVNLPGIRKQ